MWSITTKVSSSAMAITTSQSVMAARTANGEAGGEGGCEGVQSLCG